MMGWPGGDWQATATLVGTLVGAYLLIIWLASILWVYRDIRSRTRDPVSHATAVTIAVLIPLLGLPIYMVLRPSDTLQEAYDRQLEQEAILSELHSVSACPNCRRPVNSDFMICAYCATSLKQPCAHCGQLLQFSWRHCPYCATAREMPRPEPQYANQYDDEFDEDEDEEYEPVRRRGGRAAQPRQQAGASSGRERSARRPRSQNSHDDADDVPAPRPTTRARAATDEG